MDDELNFYHFLERLTDYRNWQNKIDINSKHRRLLQTQSPWANKKLIYSAFDNLFEHFQKSIIVVSYRSDESLLRSVIF